MTARDEFDRRLAHWLSETATGVPPAGRFEQAMAATAHRRPRTGWLARFGSDWVGDAAYRPIVPAWPGLRRELVAAAFMALLVAAAIVGAVLVGALLLRPDPLALRIGSLAYAVDGDIYLTRAEGGPPIVVADGRPNGPRTYLDPHWAPDGRHLLYHEVFGTTSVVHVTDPAGNPVASFPGRLSTWAPDSSRIATWLPSRQVGIRAPDGRVMTTVAVPDSLQGFDDQGPRWLSDGSAIVLPRFGPIREGNDGPEPWVLPIDGASPRRLSLDVTRQGPVPSPDGTWIAIDAEAGLVVTRADGTGARTLLTRPGLSADMEGLWSPRGDRIVVTWSGNGVPDLVQVVDPTTGSAESIYSGSRRAEQPEYGGPTAVGWSPEGRLVAVIEGPRDGSGATAWSVLAGGSWGQIVVAPAAQEGPDWRWVEEGGP